jgi:RNA polymerase sigma-70 factor (ECF subfamily)
VLREAFDYAYPEIARIVGVSPAATRQLVSRARKHIASEPRNTVTSTERRALLEAFLAAARVGDVERLEQLLAENVVTRADSNGTAKHVARVAVRGRHKVARVLSSFAEVFWAGITTRPIVVNGEEGMAMERDGELVGILAVTASAEGLHELMWQLNPEKIDPFRRARAGRATPEGSS